MLRARLAELKQPENAMDRFRPWFVTLMLVAEAIKQSGFSLELGVDRHFETLANKAHKTVLELETAMSQLDLLSSMGAEASNQQLKQLLREIETMGASFRLMIEAWKYGDS